MTYIDIAERRYVLINERTGKVCCDMMIDPARVIWANALLRDENEGWKWFEFVDLAEAA